MTAETPTWKARNLALRQRLECESARDEREYRAGRLFPHPSRITIALDARGLYGPEVDAACHAEEPAVDMWEAGDAVPSWDQLVALADLCGVTPSYFLRGEPPAPMDSWICGPSRCERAHFEPVPMYRPHADVVPLFAGRLF